MKILKKILHIVLFLVYSFLMCSTAIAYNTDEFDIVIKGTDSGYRGATNSWFLEPKIKQYIFESETNSTIESITAKASVVVDNIKTTYEIVIDNPECFFNSGFISPQGDYRYNYVIFSDMITDSISSIAYTLEVESQEDSVAIGGGDFIGVSTQNRSLSSVRHRDSTLLVAIYDSTGGANWTYTWNLNQPIDTWYGVALNCNERVKHLKLQSNQLNGTIPPQLDSLSNLTHLWLYNNQLSGGISSELSNLVNLVDLRLYGNQLSGSIPSELGGLSELTQLWLYSNNLTGNIPIELGNLTKLKNLWLHDNQLSGSIPSSLGNLTEVIHLFLNKNQLTGSIPSELGNMTNMIGLLLKNNQLSGCYDQNLLGLCDQLSVVSNSNDYISSGNDFFETWEDFCDRGTTNCSDCSQDSLNLVTIYNSTDGANWTRTWDLSQPIDTWHGVTLNDNGCVKELKLYSNQLDGIIPPQLSNLDNLTHLWLYNNRLSSVIPSQLGNLVNLVDLRLYGNQLSGSIPSELGSLAELEQLKLYNNQFSGSIPPELGNLTKLTYLWLQNNELTGNIPAELSNLKKLMYLWLNNNNLTGSIPDELGKLIDLKRLWLQNNQLSGNIPSSLENLTKVVQLGLNNNQLTGSIPKELSNMTSMIGLWLQNNQLSGCYDQNLASLCGQLSAVYGSNNYINNGNDFFETWEDFCDRGTTNCGDRLAIFSDLMGMNIQPNPFSSMTTIEFTLFREANVNVNILNPNGQNVKQLIQNKQMIEGKHHINFEAIQLPAGVYYCVLTVETARQIQKMVIVK